MIAYIMFLWYATYKIYIYLHIYCTYFYPIFSANSLKPWIWWASVVAGVIRSTMEFGNLGCELSSGRRKSSKNRVRSLQKCKCQWGFYINENVIWERNHLPTHRFIWTYSNDIKLMCTIWKCEDIDPRTDPHKVNVVCTVCFLVTWCDLFFFHLKIK